MSNYQNYLEEKSLIESVTKLSNTATFTKKQLDSLEKRFGSIKAIDPLSSNYKQFRQTIEDFPDQILKQIIDRKIKFVSGLAQNTLNRRKK